MRALWIAIAIVAASSAPALANGIQMMPGHLLPYAPLNESGGGSVPTINRGDQFAIACDNIKSAGSDVRVVMSLDDTADQQSTGYNAVLATKQVLSRHAVKVQVPDVPDLVNHTVTVKVYVTDAKGTKACDAGRVHIG